jgi:hypothetical protein
MAKFECNESEGLSCIAHLSKMDPAARWEDTEEEKWENGGVDIFAGRDKPHGGGFYSQFFREDDGETRWCITYSSYKGFSEESIKALLEESVKTPIVLARRY